MQLPETPTVKELSEFLGISRQGLEKRIKQLDKNKIATNKSGYLIVLPEGLKDLAEHYVKLSSYFNSMNADKVEYKAIEKTSNQLQEMKNILEISAKVKADLENRYDDLSAKFDRL